MPAFFVTFLVLAVLATSAHADVAVSPLRHVIDAETGEKRFVVSNPTKRILSGRVGWIDLAATPEGYAAASPEQRNDFSAAPYLLVSPAQFRLEPGGRVEIVVRRKDGPPPRGERRSHLLIETEASRTLMRRASDSGLQVDISAGISVPVLLRGAGGAAAKIHETRLLRNDAGELEVAATIKPKGDHSTFGRLSIHFDTVEGVHEVLAIRENVAAYLESDRTFSLPLNRYALGHGELTVRYDGAQEYDGIVFDERRFKVSPPD